MPNGAAGALSGGARRTWARARARWWRVWWPMRSQVGAVAKRTVDIVGVMALGLLLAPLLVVTAALIKAYDGGPVLFWQTRIGRWGRSFAFPKFRSMVLDAEQRKDELLAQNDHGSGVVTFKMKSDPRITPVGRWIRRLSIDELPQLWCVLRGQMTLVGPRPPVPREVEQYTPADRRRLDVTPGLTCLWQVSGRGDIPFPEQVKLDVEYIERHTLRFDVRLLLRTIPAVLFGRGAY